MRYVEAEKVENWLLTECASLDTEADRQYVVDRLRKEIPAADVVPMGFHERCLQIEVKNRLALEKKYAQDERRNRMLIVDGFKMAEGTATIRFREREIQTDGVFLYRPDKDMWILAPNKDFPWGGSFSREEMVEIRE